MLSFLQYILNYYVAKETKFVQLAISLSNKDPLIRCPIHIKIKIAISSQTQLYKSDMVEEFILISFQTIKQANKKKN